jgi:hypothetical protein
LFTVGVEQGIDAADQYKNRQQTKHHFPAGPGLEKHIVAGSGNAARGDISRVLDHHTETDGTQEKQKVHQGMTPGKSILFHKTASKKENVPKIGDEIGTITA